MQRVNRMRWGRALIAGALVGLLTGGTLLPAAAQQNDSTTAQKSGDEKNSLPFLLFVVQRQAKVPAARDEATNLLKDTLTDAIESAKKYNLIPFSPKQAFVRRAVLEHTIAASDLVEPLKLEGLRRIARAIGARYLLTISPTVDSAGIKTEVRFDEAVNQQDWRTLSSEQVSFGNTIGKQRLKSNELVYLTVDAIADRLNIHSHLAEKLRTYTEKQRAYEQALAKDSKAAKKDAKKETKSDTGGFVPIESAGQNGGDTANSNAAKTTAGKDKTPGATRAADSPKWDKNRPGKPTGDSKQAAKQDNATLEPGAPAAKPNSKNADKDKTAKSNTQQNEDADNARAFTTDNTPGRVTPPPIANVAPPPTAIKPDPEAVAARFRQLGDLPNVIIALRRAINDRPREMNLRRQLIQAYQENKMPEQAMAEALRALQLNPNDSTLLRLRGDSLLAQGDIPGALKSYREAMQRDPSDVTAQVALGDALLKDNQYAEAFSAYEAAAKTDPRSPLPHRRLARALTGRAGADPTQYAAALAEIQKARSLTPAADTDTYLEDYVALITLMEKRLRDLLEGDLQSAFQDYINARRKPEEVKRTAGELKQRAEAAVDYLDKLPPAAGNEQTHAQYLQGATLALQAVSLFCDFVAKESTSTEEAMRGATVDALRTLTAASKRLKANRSATEPDKVSGGAVNTAGGR